MENDDDRIEFDISYAISRTSLRPRHRNATENDQERAFAAQRILEHLKLCGWRFWRRAPAPPHSIG
jgi:hypothetical protein